MSHHNVMPTLFLSLPPSFISSFTPLGATPWLTHHLLGFTPTVPGWQEYDLVPQFGFGLNSSSSNTDSHSDSDSDSDSDGVISGSVPTPHGPLTDELQVDVSEEGGDDPSNLVPIPYINPFALLWWLGSISSSFGAF